MLQASLLLSYTKHMSKQLQTSQQYYKNIGLDPQLTLMGECALYQQASGPLHITDNYFYNNKHQHNMDKERASSRLGSCNKYIWIPTFQEETQFPF